MKIFLGLAGLLALALIGCSDGGNDNPTPSDHAWNEQVEAMDRAKQVEQVLIDSQEQRRQAIESMRQ